MTANTQDHTWLIYKTWDQLLAVYCFFWTPLGKVFHEGSNTIWSYRPVMPAWFPVHEDINRAPSQGFLSLSSSSGVWRAWHWDSQRLILLCCSHIPLFKVPCWLRLQNPIAEEDFEQGCFLHQDSERDTPETMPSLGISSTCAALPSCSRAISTGLEWGIQNFCWSSPPTAAAGRERQIQFSLERE